MNRLLMQSRRSRLVKYGPYAVAVAVLAVAPFVVGPGYWRNALVLAMLYSVVAASWDITLGYAGLFNWAHLAFFAIGAYAAGIFGASVGLSPWLCIPVGAIAGAISGAVVCLPVLRVKGVYVALVTFAFAQVCYQIVLAAAGLTGGTYGLTFLPSVGIGGYSFLEDGQIGYYFLALGLLIGSAILLLRAVKSRWGLGTVALRDNESYAVSRGVPAVRQRLIAFVVSGTFAGAAGAVYAFYLGVVSPDLFGFSYIAIVLSMVLLGGSGTIWGPILGAFAMTFMTQSMQSFGNWSYLVVASVTVTVILLWPGGIIGGARKLSERYLSRSVDLTSTVGADANRSAAEQSRAQADRVLDAAPPS